MRDPSFVTTGTALAPGSLLAGFRIESMIGRGGMAVVYRATQLSLERQVALKLISPELSSEERFRERFLREARLAASIDHPHLLPVHEAGEAEGTLFLAMRLVEGVSLAELLRREGALPLGRALRLFSQLCSALEAAHEAGLLHRDVKPANVLLAGEGEHEHAYLCDFGLARRLAGGSLTKERAFLGTATYAAPEQIRGEELDGRCDLYSLACLLYECLSGEPPFQAEDELALCWAHLHEPAPSPSTLDPALAGFDPFFQRALAKDRDGRFPSASELVKGAQAALAGTLPAAPPAAGPPLKLPRPATTFLGRERELQEVLELLLDEDVRLLSLTGPGGTGKTRLALRAAEEAAPAFPDGIFWVGLAPLRDASLLERTFALGLEVNEQPGVALADSIVGAFAVKRTLVVVDNCEHLVDAVSDLVRKLVEGCPKLVVIASSRERLGLRTERTFSVPPMTPADSERLFVERARAVHTDFVPDEHVSAICEAVDGLPLAVELAAARVRSLSTQSILERLGQRLSLLTSRDRDVDERQRTLEATIAWSYDLLDLDEQRVLRRLSVFAGGCTLEAAEHVAGADLDRLESLLDKSLLRHGIDEAGQDRYWMLETIREYVAARLEHSGEADSARSVHRSFFTDRAAELGAGELIRGEDLSSFEADRANYRVVLLDAIAEGDGASALRLVAALGSIWMPLGEVADSYALVRSVLALTGGGAAERGLASCAAGELAVELGELAEAERLLDEADTYAAASGDDLLGYRVLRVRYWLAMTVGDYMSAIEWTERALQIARTMGSHDLEMNALGKQVQAMRIWATDRDEIDAAALHRCLPLAERQLEWARQSESLLEQSSAHHQIAGIYLGLSRTAVALRHQQASLQLDLVMGSRFATDSVLALGIIACQLGQHENAVKLTAAVLRHHEREGTVLWRDEARQLHRLELEAREALGDDRYEEAMRAGEALTQEEAVELALGLEFGPSSAG